MIENEKEKLILKIEYDLFSRVLVLMFRLLAILLGLGFISVGKAFPIVGGLLFIIFGVLGFFRNIFFKNMNFYNDCIVSEWSIFGMKFSRRILYSKINVSKSNHIFGGTISVFRQKNRWKSVSSVFYFSLDQLALNQEEIKKIKKILIEKKVIKGDEYVWID